MCRRAVLLARSRSAFFLCVCRPVRVRPLPVSLNSAQSAPPVSYRLPFAILVFLPLLYPCSGYIHVRVRVWICMVGVLSTTPYSTRSFTACRQRTGVFIPWYRKWYRTVPVPPPMPYQHLVKLVSPIPRGRKQRQGSTRPRDDGAHRMGTGLCDGTNGRLRGCQER